MLKTFVEKNPAMALMICCILGLLLPGMEKIPAWVIILSLALGVFIACFGIKLQEISQLHPTRVLGFYISRFIILPVLGYYLLSWLAPKFALAVFLLIAVPPGVSSPAMNRLFGGNISLGFTLTLLGNILIPFILPFMLFELVGQKTQLDTQGMMRTLVFTILVPMLVFLLFRRNGKIRKLVDYHGAYLTVLCIGLSIAIAVANRRGLILSDPRALIPDFFWTSAWFAVFYVFGWVFFPKAPRRDKIAQSLGSGAINISLGVSIALLYFPPEISLFLIVGEIPWILALMPFKSFVLGRRIPAAD